MKHPTLQDLHEISVWPWLLHAAGNWLELAMIYVLIWQVHEIYPSLWVYWIGSLFLGARMQGLALLGHEGLHHTISKNKIINNVLASFTGGYPLFSSIGLFKWFHLDHHQHLGDRYRDPEISFREKTPTSWGLPLNRRKLIGTLVRDLLGLGIWESRHVVLANKNLRVWDIAQPLTFWILAWAFFWKMDLLWIPILWNFSYLTSYWASFRLRAFFEHLGTDRVHRFHANWLERYFFLPHNCWYHYEHHKWPKIPFYNLAVARALDSSVSVTTTSDILKSYSEAPLNGYGRMLP